MKTIIHVSQLAAPPDKVFEALTTLTGLAAWWTTKVKGDAGPAGVIDLTFDGDFNPTMQVTYSDAPSMLSWKCVAGVQQWRENTFRFWLEAHDAGAAGRGGPPLHRHHARRRAALPASQSRSPRRVRLVQL